MSSAKGKLFLAFASLNAGREKPFRHFNALAWNQRAGVAFLAAPGRTTGDLTQVNAELLRLRLMATMNEETLEIPRRRKASPDALSGREAATLVRELNRQLGNWQSISVKLHTMAERLKLSGRSDPAVAEQARVLFEVVSAEARRFEAILSTQPAAISQHGRIKDTRQSFEMISHRLRLSLKLLGIEPNKE